MTKTRIVVSLPNDNAYQHEQGVVAKMMAEQLGLELQVMKAEDDAITQSQQLLKIIQGPAEQRPSAFLVEPVTATGLRRVAEEAVAAGIGWVVSNSDVDYVKQLRKNSQIPVFTVTQGQFEIGRLQGKQMAALLPEGGAALVVEGPSMSAVANQRHEGFDTAKPRNAIFSTVRSKWSEDSAQQSVASWLKLATSRAEKFHLVAGQTHELAIGARKAFQGLENQEQQRKWLELPYLGIGISSQVRHLVEGKILAGAVVTSVTMGIALRLVMRALESQVQPPECTVVEVASFPELEKLRARG